MTKKPHNADFSACGPDNNNAMAWAAELLKLQAACDHEWVEGVDEEGQLVEPAYDVCVHCGLRQD